MRNFFVILLWVFLALLLQTTVLPRFVTAFAGVTGLNFLQGQTIDLCLLTLVYLSFQRTLSGILIWGVLLGIMAGWFGLAWKGAYAASIFLTGIASWIAARQVLLRNAGSIALVAGVLSLMSSILHLEGAHLFSKIEDPFHGQVWFMILKAFLDAALAPMVFFFLRLLDRWTGSEPSRGSSVLLPGIEL